MLVAWIVFATMAILVARYLKDAWGDICGKKGWFQVSLKVMIEFLEECFTLGSVLMRRYTVSV